MKTNAIQALRRKLAADVPVYGLWVTLEAPSVTEMAVALGLDWVVIDAEHGHLDWKEIVEHLRATVRSETVALVRIATLDVGFIKRALDLGADGVVAPWIESAEQLTQAVAFARYPVEGVRGIGAERATAWGQAFAEHTAEANEHVLVVPIFETVTAAKRVEELARVAGVELAFFGPADLSSSAGHRGQWEGPGVAEQIAHMKDVLRAAGKQCGVVATSLDDLEQRRRQGFRMIALGIDTGLLLRSLRGALASVGRDRVMRASLVPGPPAVLPRPPVSLRPDRMEAICAPGDGPQMDITPGVALESFVGAFNRARKLTTGRVTFSPGARLPCHTHPFTESITLLSGEAVVDVEGRQYSLKLRDNVVLPAGVAHAVLNPSPTQDAIFHVALASDAPTRDLVDRVFPTKRMPDDSAGVTGAERVNRFACAARGTAGPNTEFIDCFNNDLLPGLEMSGGYGLFHPGGRLPAHVHDFDESISIISGEATCIVEGRRYTMSGGRTAFVPRGRVHYFINESAGPMEMLWVYAGPMPERIIVDERCATAEGDPWK
ncbi:MAG: aldolase/citrate lyase family protein [Planctomycetota bacterium]